MNVEQQRPARVGRIGHVRCAAGEVPDQPRIDGAKSEFAAFRACPRIGHVVEQPFEFGPGEVRIDHQAGFLRDQVGGTRRAQRIAQIRGAPILPDDRVGHGLARRALPDDGGFALVGDADGRNVRGADAGLGQCLGHHSPLRGPDFGRIVLDPSRPRIDLREFPLRAPMNVARMIEDDRARTGRALVQCKHERHDDKSSCLRIMVTQRRAAATATRSRPRRRRPSNGAAMR